MTTNPGADRRTPGTAQSPRSAARHPGELTARDWRQVLRRTVRELGNDHVFLVAAGVAYTWFLGLFPGLIAAAMVYGLVTDPADVERQVANLAAGLPGEAQTLLTDQMSAIAETSDRSLSIGLAVSLLVALWSTSAGMAGLLQAVNLAYDEERRRFAVRRGLALLLTVGCLIFLALAIGLIAVLPVVLEQLGLSIVAERAVQATRWVGLVVVALVAIGLVYRVGPNRRAAEIRWLSVGTVAATVLWLLSSIGMAVFIDTFGRYGRTYGSLAGVVVLLLWLWMTAVAVLLGAELNSEAEAQTTHDTTKGAPRPMGQRGAVKADRPPPTPE